MVAQIEKHCFLENKIQELRSMSKQHCEELEYYKTALEQ